MTYASKSDLETRFGAEDLIRLTDRLGSGMADSAIITAALTDADTEINGYLAVLYTLPLTTTPELVKRIACDIARYRLWKDRASEQVRTGYEDAVSLLKRISSGTVKIPVAGISPTGTSDGVTSTRAPVFTAATLALMP
jgi:phage gp36-like protein